MRIRHHSLERRFFFSQVPLPTRSGIAFATVPLRNEPHIHELDLLLSKHFEFIAASGKVNERACLKLDTRFANLLKAGQTICRFDHKRQFVWPAHLGQLGIRFRLSLLPVGAWLIGEQAHASCDLRTEPAFDFSNGGFCVFGCVVKVCDKYRLLAIRRRQSGYSIQVESVGLIAIPLLGVGSDGEGSGLLLHWDVRLIAR